MVDALGGACVYDESARYEAGGYGVLGFLLASNDALASMNIDERTLGERAIASLPEELRALASQELMEVRMHRWCGGVSGQPCCLTVGDATLAHQTDAHRLPGLLFVGDYLFDSTLNAVLQSAELVVGLLADAMDAGDAGRADLRPAGAVASAVGLTDSVVGAESSSRRHVAVRPLSTAG